MNQGARLLLERMKSHPEEFTEGHKWTDIINEIKSRCKKVYPDDGAKPLPFLTDEDAKTLYNSWAELQGSRFTREVMRRIVLDKGDDIEALTYSGDLRYNVSELVYKR